MEKANVIVKAGKKVTDINKDTTLLHYRIFSGSKEFYDTGP
jgi:hypothetical protein